jgi:hypothetical protein
MRLSSEKTVSKRAYQVHNLRRYSTAIYSANDSKAPVATLLREPTGEMGAQGLKGMYSSAEDFGTRVAGTRRGSLESSREGGGSAGGVYIAEGKAAIRGGGGEAAWIELIAVGCRGSEAARKYNLSQTVRIVSGGAGGAPVAEGVRAMMDSFQLTAGKTCAAP